MFRALLPNSGRIRRGNWAGQGLAARLLRTATVAMVGWMMVIVLSGGLSAQDKVYRGESKVSMGVLVHDVFGIMKSFGYYIIPRYVAVDVNFQYIVRELPIGINLSLNLPMGRITPFVTGGAAASLRGTTIFDAGVGLKVRVGKRTSILAEYRHFRYKYRPAGSNDPKELRTADYFGGGISYDF